MAKQNNKSSSYTNHENVAFAAFIFYNIYFITYVILTILIKRNKYIYIKEFLIYQIKCKKVDAIWL